MPSPSPTGEKHLMGSKYKGVFRRVLPIPAGILVFLAAAEIAVRGISFASRTVRRQSYLRADFTQADYQGAKNVVDLVQMAPYALPPFAKCRGYVLNSSGLRTREYGVRRIPGTRRIVVVGDSFFFENSWVPDAWHVVTHLERNLGRNPPVEVINLSVPGVSPKFELSMVEIEASRLGADVVIQAFYAGNDLTEEPEDIGYFPPKERLLMHLHSFRLARNLSQQAAWRVWSAGGVTGAILGMTRTCGGYPDSYPGTWPPPSPLNEREMRNYVAGSGFIYWKQWPDWLNLHWQRILGMLRSTRRAAEKSGARYLLVVIPAEAQVDPAWQKVVRDAWPGRQIDLEKAQRLLSKWASSEGVSMLDLLPILRTAHEQGIEVYQPLDTHWGPEGQRLAAEAIAGALRRMLNP